MRLIFRNIIGKEMSQLSGGRYFLIAVKIFSMAKICNYYFCSTAFVDKIIRGNI